MADTITGLIPDIYEAMDVVSREKVGMIQSVTIDAVDNRAALNQQIVVDVAPAISGTNITGAMTPTAAADLTEGTASITLNKSRAFKFNFSGIVTQQLNTSIGAANTRVGRIAQALRAATNEIETDLGALHAKFSRAYGTAGTTPFASNLAGTAQVGKILDDNGAPAVDRSLVIDTSAGANLRTLTQLNQQNTAGTDATLRMGELLDVHGLSLKESAQVNTFTAGAMASATTDATGYAVGTTTVTLATAGTGTVSAGDIITFAGDTNQYVVTSATFAGANPAAGDTITIGAPGLRVAIPAAATAITVVATSARNMAFSRNAIVLATRMPELPDEGDMAADRMTVTDPVTGMSFEFAIYKGYRQNLYEVAINWGADVIKPEHTALLLG